MGIATDAGATGKSVSAHESSFLALLRKLLFAFFGLKQHVVRIAQALFPALPCFPVAVPLIKLKVVQVFQKFLVKFGLQFQREARKKFAGFGVEQSGFL
jgi:hypothetical protein